MFRFPVFNMDIYLDETTVDNGCLRVFPGSHLTGYHAPDRYPGFLPSWTNGSDENAAKDAIPVPAKRGDVIFHTTTLIHCSPWNRSDDLRRTVYFHFDHRLDVELAGDRWPQRQFADARASDRPGRRDTGTDAPGRATVPVRVRVKARTT